MIYAEMRVTPQCILFKILHGFELKDEHTAIQQILKSQPHGTYVELRDTYVELHDTYVEISM